MHTNTKRERDDGGNRSPFEQRKKREREKSGKAGRKKSDFFIYGENNNF